jgi:two-component system chemotaxis sensor kinase CheA
VTTRSDPYRYFRVEARELVTELSRSTLALERGENVSAVVSTILRAAHTLKGAARVVKQLEIADLAHRVEDLLAPHRSSDSRVAPAVLDTVLSLVDSMSAHLGRLEGTVPRAPVAVDGAADANSPRIDEGARIARTETGELDRLLDGLGQAHVSVGGIRRDASTLERTRLVARALHDQLATRQRGDERMRLLSEELLDGLEKAERRMRARLDEVERELDEARAVAERMRLVPVSFVVNVLERTTRDAARELGKEVRFEATGVAERLDAQVLSVLQGALVQLVRNAVAHGIETPDERRRAGKPAEGRITLDMARRGRRVTFRCSDDGRGFDVRGLERAARAKGIALPDDQQESATLFRLLLGAGITTMAQATAISGRGVGLDVVRDAMEKLHGEVFLETSDAGSIVALDVPISLAAIEVLVMETPAGLAAVPVDSVERVVWTPAANIVRREFGDGVFHDDAIVAFAPLERLLTGERRERKSASWTVVVLSSGSRRAAIGVERIRGAESVVMRPLPDLSPAAPIIAGASLDAEGNPRIVLDAEAVVAAARHGVSEPEPVRDVRKRRVLVVDDSLTTRMLEQSILETAGYAVDLASSGEEGLERAKDHRYDAFLVDVEMPGIDGFTFVERVAVDPATRGVPAILVTSRNAPEDRERAAQAGARGYIVKGEFDQRDLLRRLHALVS